MFTVISTEKNKSRNDDTYTYACLSTDTKKTAGIKNGSVLLEMDTKKVYLFDEAGSTWREWA